MCSAAQIATDGEVCEDTLDLQKYMRRRCTEREINYVELDVTTPNNPYYGHHKS